MGGNLYIAKWIFKEIYTFNLKNENRTCHGTDISSVFVLVKGNLRRFMFQFIMLVVKYLRIHNNKNFLIEKNYIK